MDELSEQQLLDMLENGDADAKIEAITEFGKRGSERAIPGLTKIVESRVWELERVALQSLAMIGTDEAVNVLSAQLDHHRLPRMVSQALVMVRSKKGIPALLKAHRRYYDDHDVSGDVQMALEHLGVVAAQPLMTFIEDASEPTDARIDAIDYLIEVTREDQESVTDFLLKIFQDKTNPLRRKVAFTLGKTHSQRVVGSIIEALNDPDANVRMGATKSAEDLHNSAVLVPLLDMLSDENESVAARAREALQNGISRLVRERLDMLQNPDQKATERVKQALKDILEELSEDA